MRAELHVIALDGLGKLNVMARPRGGDWLWDEIQAWRDTGVDVIVSLLTPAEQLELELVGEATLCERQGLIFISCPIPDHGMPRHVNKVESLIEVLAQYLTQGRHVAVHCRMGIGRSVLMAAATLVALGETAARALAMIQAARGCQVPDTLEQQEWVEQFAARVHASTPDQPPA
jgi:protein-tyrosine phosphatase